MLNKILAILLVAMTMVHGGRSRVEYSMRYPQHEEMTRDSNKRSYIKQIRANRQYDQGEISRACKAAQNLPVRKSFMKILNLPH
jgi:hypothetical protein